MGKKIEMGKDYVTRDGTPVRLLCVDAPNVQYPVVFLDNGVVRQCSDEGAYYNGGSEHRWDLFEVKKVAFPQFKCGDLVRVSDHKASWNVRVFSHSDQCLAYTFNMTTKMNNSNNVMGLTVTAWNFCEPFEIPQEK